MGFYIFDTAFNLTNLVGSFTSADHKRSGGYPPILSIEQAAELGQLPVETLRSWRSRKLLDDCSRRVGKRVRFFRDRFVQWLFNGAANRK